MTKWWHREGETLYLIAPTGRFRKGEPIFENLLEVSLRSNFRKFDDNLDAPSKEEVDEFVNRLQTFLNTELDLGEPLTDLQEDAYAPGGPLAGVPKPEPVKLMARIWKYLDDMV